LIACSLMAGLAVVILRLAEAHLVEAVRNCCA